MSNKLEGLTTEIDPDADAYINRAAAQLPQFFDVATGVFRNGFQNRQIAVAEKSPRDFVTEVDRKIEDIFRKWVQANFPDANVFGEEDGMSTQNTESDWLYSIDPVDATTNYINGDPECSTVVSLRYKEDPVLAVCRLPMKNEEYVARKGRGVQMNGEVITPPTREGRLERNILIIPRFKTLSRMQNVVGNLWDKVGGVHMKMSCITEVCDVISGRAGLGVWLGMGPQEWPAAYLFARESGCEIATLEDRSEAFDYSGMGKRNVIIAGNKLIFDQARDHFGLPEPPPLQ